MFLKRIFSNGKLFRKVQHAVSFSRKLSHGRNYYVVLGVKQDATQDEIREAYLKRAKEIHPDSNPTDPLSHDLFVELNNAHDTLSNPSMREKYDDILSRTGHWYRSDSWRRHTQPPPHTDFGQDAYGEDSQGTHYAPDPPKWTESFRRKEPEFEEDYDHLTFWQRHWFGVVLFVFIQLHVFALYYHIADLYERQSDETWFYDNMDEDEFEKYINTMHHDYDHISDMFNPAKQKELADRRSLIEKLRGPPQRYQLSYLPENFKQLKVPEGWQANVIADSNTNSAAQG